ncbi:N-acetyltransferase [Actinoplanes regularis]|nr:N-acetyltransferase [Actinoplanes regularis]
MFVPVVAAIVSSMKEPLIDIVAAPDPPGAARWRAVAPGGVVAGVAGLWPVLPFGHDLLPPPAPAVRPDAAELSLHVEPAWRRRGIGSRLLEAVRARATGPCLVADVAVDSAGEAFCLRHGFRRTGSRRHGLLVYSEVHPAWLGELIDAGHPGYLLTHWSGGLAGPPRLLHGSAGLRGPGLSGNAVLTAAGAGGDVAAYAVAVADEFPLPRARQYGPTVLPGHRGRRLGRWVNAALIQRLREVHPHVDEIETAAAEDDTHLLAVHEHLGFQPLRRTQVYELALP